MIFWFVFCINILLTPINAGGGCSKLGDDVHTSEENAESSGVVYQIPEMPKTLMKWIEVQHKRIFDDDIPTLLSDSSENILKYPACATTIVTSLMVLENADTGIDDIKEVVEHYDLIASEPVMKVLIPKVRKKAHPEIPKYLRRDCFWKSWLLAINECIKDDNYLDQIEALDNQSADKILQDLKKCKAIIEAQLILHNRTY